MRTKEEKDGKGRREIRHTKMKGRGRRNNKQKKWIQQNEISEIKQRREEGEGNYAYKINTLDEKGKKKTTQKRCNEAKSSQRKERKSKQIFKKRKKKKRRRKENEKERQRPRRNSECPVQTDLTKAPDNIK